MDAVADFINKARSGDLEGAFHGLREIGLDDLPSLRMAYHREADPIVRSVIVEAVWQHRHSSVIEFLADAIRDPAPMVWKQALDGLVTLATSESMRVLQSAANAEVDAERRAWISEAIDQAADLRSHGSKFAPG